MVLTYTEGKTTLQQHGFGNFSFVFFKVNYNGVLLFVIKIKKILNFKFSLISPTRKIFQLH